MTYRYTGDGILKGNLTVNSGKPLDTRSVVQSLSDLYSMPTEVVYIGMIVAVIDEETIYILKDISNIDNETGWKRIGSIDNIDSKVTKESSNPVTSSGIYSHVDNKFVFLTEEEYNDMETHDADTFYFIKQ